MKELYPKMGLRLLRCSGGGTTSSKHALPFHKLHTAFPSFHDLKKFLPCPFIIFILSQLLLQFFIGYCFCCVANVFYQWPYQILTQIHNHHVYKSFHLCQDTISETYAYPRPLFESQMNHFC